LRIASTTTSSALLFEDNRCDLRLPYLIEFGGLTNTTIQPTMDEDSKSSSDGLIAGLIAGLIFMFLILIGIAILILYLWYRRRKSRTFLDTPIEMENKSNSLMLQENLVIGDKIGSGNFGDVFKGTLGPLVVAVRIKENFF